MILVECATPVTSHAHPYALAWAQFHFWFRNSTIASLCTRLLLLATVQRPCTTASGLRPLSYVIPTAFRYGYVIRFPLFQPRHLRSEVPFLGFALRHLGFGLAYCGKPPCKGSRVGV